MSGDPTIGTFGAFAIIGLLVFTFVLLPLYVLGSLGLMSIARKYGQAHDWAAWIPFYNTYLLGKIAYNNQMGVGMSIAAVLSFGDWVVSILPSPFSFIPLGCFVLLMFFSLHKMYKKLSEKSLLMSVSTLLSCGVLFPIFLFVISRNECALDCDVQEKKTIPETTGDKTDINEELEEL